MDYYQNGLDAGLVEKMWPLVPTAIATVEQFLATAIKFEQAKELADSKVRPDQQIAALTERTPGLLTREEFYELTIELKQTILGLKKELLSQVNLQTNSHRNPEPTARYQHTHQNPPRPRREQGPDQSYFARYQPPTEFYQRAQPRDNYRNQRTSDGRPVCNSCGRPGHRSKNCSNAQNRYPDLSRDLSRQDADNARNKLLHALHTVGDDQVTTTVLCNGVYTKALIDTGAAITAVSEEFANKFP